MIEVTGDLWSEDGKANLLLVTTNAYVKNNGCLVMGRGAAKEMVDRYPQISLSFGCAIQPNPGRSSIAMEYLILTTDQDHLSGRPGPVPTLYGAFQVKHHFRDKASLKLIRKSAERLAEIAPDGIRIAMNYPGIGNGGLLKSEVGPIIKSILPDNVFVYTRGS
jgi:hypothetical protein